MRVLYPNAKTTRASLYVRLYLLTFIRLLTYGVMSGNSHTQKKLMDQGCLVDLSTVRLPKSNVHYIFESQLHPFFQRWLLLSAASNPNTKKLYFNKQVFFIRAFNVGLIFSVRRNCFCRPQIFSKDDWSTLEGAISALIKVQFAPIRI